MQTTTRLATLALTITLSVGPALAQQPVRRTSTKPAARSAASATRTAQTPVKKTALAPAPTVAAKTEAHAETSATKPVSEPVASRQPEAHTQPVARQATARPQLVKGANGRHVYLNAGVGLAAYYGGGLPLGVSAEVDVKNNFSVGGSIDYFRYNYGYYSGGYTFIYAGARASYHLGEALNVQNSEFDPYIGASLGFRHASYHDSYGYSYSDYGSGYNSGLWIGIHAGARYLFSPKIGAFAEVGYGVSALKVGLTAKF